jgi:uncharacterized protein YndB with AHSA1/START domain
VFEESSMRLAVIAGVVIILVIVIVLAYAATKPDTIVIQRSATINASPPVVFALINDLHNWPRWAPQDREDPTMRRMYSGEMRGTGAVSDWTSSGNAGAGRVTIVNSVPDREIEAHVDFRKPFVAHNINTFILGRDRDGTRLTWSMQGTNVYLMKVMSLVVSPDRMLGQHFEAGLSNLKAAAETAR